MASIGGDGGRRGRGRCLATRSWWEGGDQEQGGKSGLQMSMSLLGWASREGEMCVNGPGQKKSGWSFKKME